MRALAELGRRSGHPELERVPWALWGHSGGANWAGTKLLLHPGRVVAVWLRSGAPRLVTSVAGPALETPVAALAVPVMCNPGVKEKTHERFSRAWNSGLSFFAETRARGGLIGFAPDPRTSHECGDSRYLAIPFFDACLAQRLPAQPGAANLRAMDASLAWLAPVQSDTAHPVREYVGKPEEAVWLPTAAVAAAWRAYVRTGTGVDTTQPPAPTQVRIAAGGILTWEATADLESGLGGFVLERDGVELARLPANPSTQFRRSLFQKMSYHDTPSLPLPEMRYVDVTATAGMPHAYRVAAVNSAGLKSDAVAAAGP